MSAQTLSSLPGSCTAIRKELEQICGVSLEGVTYKTIWKSLVCNIGLEAAEKATQDLLEMHKARSTGSVKSNAYLKNSLLPIF